MFLLCILRRRSWGEREAKGLVSLKERGGFHCLGFGRPSAPQYSQVQEAEEEGKGEERVVVAAAAFPPRLPCLKGASLRIPLFLTQPPPLGTTLVRTATVHVRRSSLPPSSHTRAHEDKGEVGVEEGLRNGAGKLGRRTRGIVMRRRKEKVKNGCCNGREEEEGPKE